MPLNNFKVKNNKLLIGEIKAEDLVRKYGSPIYVYNSNIIKSRFNEIKNSIPKASIYYACKANSNIEILKILKKEGARIETVSAGEVITALNAGFKPDEIIYTCSNISKEELKYVIDTNIIINLDSLTQIRRFGEIKPNSKISIRINQGIGSGHHKHVITGGSESKFGIYISQVDEAIKIAKEYNLQITGIHQHIGSNILDYKILLKAIQELLKTAKKFESLESIDIGGGFGIPYKPNEKPLNVVKLGKLILQEFKKFVKDNKKEVIVRLEPGRYIIAEAGILLATVTEVKKTPFKVFVGVDSGFNHLIRPAMYDSYHKIVNASNVTGPQEIVSVAGNVCESGDLFARNRKLTKFKEGDVLALLDAGAYGYSMSSQYNLRSQPIEVMVEGKTSKVIRKRSIAAPF